MRLVEFPEADVVVGADQPEYIPLPAHRVGNHEGELVCCWRLTWSERLRLLLSGRLWHSILTFNDPLQPQRLSVEKPAMMINGEL